MTNRKDALTELLAKVEAGNRITYDDTDKVCSILIPKATMVDASMFKDACMGDSLDAAKSLHEAVLPGWLVDALWQNPDYGPNPRLWSCRLRHSDGLSQCVGDDYYKASTTPARAWLIAILKALIAGENTNERED
jgi:hypothetical protein